MWPRRGAHTHRDKTIISRSRSSQWARGKGLSSHTAWQSDRFKECQQGTPKIEKHSNQGRMPTSAGMKYEILIYPNHGTQQQCFQDFRFFWIVRVHTAPIFFSLLQTNRSYCTLPSPASFILRCETARDGFPSDQYCINNNDTILFHQPWSPCRFALRQPQKILADSSRKCAGHTDTNGAPSAFPWGGSKGAFALHCRDASTVKK